MSDNPIGTGIYLHSGEFFDFDAPEYSHFTVTDIAHALSMISRFTGHTTKFYSVAQHSVLVSELVPERFALMGLLHDAAEAFIGDISTPLKQMLPDYKRIEARVERAVRHQLNIPHPLPADVKYADRQALGMEKRDLLPQAKVEWEILKGIGIPATRILPVGPTEAKTLFMRRYLELT